jgi:hypothetical protein
MKKKHSVHCWNYDIYCIGLPGRPYHKVMGGFLHRARICKRLRSPVGSKESTSPTYVAFRAGTTDRVIVLGLLKRLQSRALVVTVVLLADGWQILEVTRQIGRNWAKSGGIENIQTGQFLGALGMSGQILGLTVNSCVIWPILGVTDQILVWLYRLWEWLGRFYT